jgi:SAM-dependent methyltransferase
VRSALPVGATRVLEVGCGDGALAAALGEAGLEVVAIDSDPEMVAIAWSRGVQACEAVWPDFSGGTFDAVLFARSLHHVRKLEASVAAAFASLSGCGRVIVEDFLAEGEPRRSQAWFDSLASLLHRSGLLPRPTDFLRGRLGLEMEQAAHHDHDLHPSTAIAAALRAQAATFRCRKSAYYFRYLQPALDDRTGLAEALLAHERDLIAGGLIDALGRRYVAVGAGR